MNRKQHIIQVPDVKKVGVYAIHNKITGKYYVGSSSNVNSRLKTHRSNIEKLYGSNMKMDEDLKTEDDIKNFEFLILETFNDYEITETKLRERESFYIRNYNGYNVSGRNPYINGYFGENELLTSKKISYGKHLNYKDIVQMSNIVLLQRYSKMLLSEKQHENELAMMKQEILKRMDK